MSVNSIINKPPGYAGTGRPSKLTPELQEKVCSIIADGNYPTTACLACGVAEPTFRQWIINGQEELDNGRPGRFTAFMLAVKEAEAKSEIQLVKDVKLHTSRNVVAPLALLDRRFRERWGQTPPPQAQGNTYNVNIDKAIIDASEKFKAIMGRLAERAEEGVVMLEVPVTADAEDEDDE